MKVKKRVKYIDTPNGKLKILIYDSRKDNKLVPGLLWIHGGGYVVGFPSMVRISRAYDILKRYETVVISPAYRLAKKAPYPAALEDCTETLLYMEENAKELGIDLNKIMIGGESAGGGLCLSTYLYANSKKNIDIKYLFPLYPMINCKDTESSKDNHAYVWNTKRNHYGWKKYLGNKVNQEEISEFASPSFLKDYKVLPPFYTFVSDGEPFYCETVDFVNKAKEAGINAVVDVYHLKTHAFDMICPWLKETKKAKKRFMDNYEMVVQKYLK